MTVNLFAPFSGELMALTSVSDETFASKMMGDGLAIKPETDEIYAPVTGRIEVMQKHALGFSLKGGLEVLLHIGIDTVALPDEVFVYSVKAGDEVTAGQVIGRVDWQAVDNAGLERTTMLVVTNSADKLEKLTAKKGTVKAGEACAELLIKGATEAKTVKKPIAKKQKFKLGGFFQELGKTFMLPVALMAFMGLMLGLGSSFSSPSTIDAFPFLGNSVLQVIFRFLGAIGGFAFSNLPVMFAMAIPLGLAKKEKGVAAFSGFVGYMVMNLSINFFLTETGHLAKEELMQKAGQGMALGVQTIEMGVLGGIITGIIVYNLHKKFYNIQLSDSFAFFGGPRFVPIISSLVMAIVGIIIPFIWPLFAFLIGQVGRLIQSAGVFGPFLFFSGERLLLPFGLHHILVATIRFTQAGGSAMINGHEVFGALNIFYAELQNHLPISGRVTSFLSQGKMPTFMFGLPGAALAMYHTAKPENRKKIKGLLISGVIATFVTGITEPIEFLFLFISPFLWIFHVIMTGAGALVVSLLGVKIGNTDGGILDFLIFGVMQGGYTKWYLIPLVGVIWFFLYYFIFKKVILWKNLKTPGRETQLEPEYSDEELSNNGTANSEYDAPAILSALGGKENIESLDNCITRLRLILKDGNIVDDAKLMSLGALGVVHLDDTSLQVIIGTKVTTVRNALDQLI
ncbi:maltose/glucose-specific PTS transporter subunit IIBC [Lactococcus termiticola]|uniref:Maltose/glucose-specific PTS system IIBC component n=1 Tax=Lactococcus termiticola TaxID=2169526 RepID=A0A2R5HGM9_9LACT|nr:maltose/glucose-specific PTS transporter subunit IIBC [Lactococcus termiticola]GBG97142.1 maltose/glucose-specific PTS system IIBC component [Lactococcus termiticola]